MRYRKDLRWGSGITRQEQHRGGQRGKDLRAEGQMGGQREAEIERGGGKDFRQWVEA